MSSDFEYRLNPAYCIYKGVAIEQQYGSKISFAISDKSVKKTVKRGFYDFVEQIRCMTECPPEYTKRASVKFKLKSKEDIERIVTSQIGGIYTEDQLLMVERICAEKSGLIVIATESDSENYKSLLHLKMDADKKNSFLIEHWDFGERGRILKALIDGKLVFVEMKKSNVSEVLSELKKEDFFSDEILIDKLKGIIVQDTHEYLEKEDLLADIAVLKSRRPTKAFLKMSDDEKENCFIHYTNFGCVLKVGRERLYEKKGKSNIRKIVSFALLFCIILPAFVSCKSLLPACRMNNEIRNGFITTCMTREFPSLCEWQKYYRKKWQLDYIGWTRADNFIVDLFTGHNEYPLYYGYWEKNKGVGEKIGGEVYCRRKIVNDFENDLPPYRISGELDYSDLQLNFKYWFFNNNNKNIRCFTIVFYLFDEDGNPPEMIRNNVVLNENQFVEGYSNVSKRIPLNRFFEMLPDEEYTMDYLYVSKIEFTDGTVWSDPFGMKYLN